MQVIPEKGEMIELTQECCIGINHYGVKREDLLKNPLYRESEDTFAFPAGTKILVKNIETKHSNSHGIYRFWALLQVHHKDIKGIYNKTRPYADVSLTADQYRSLMENAKIVREL